MQTGKLRTLFFREFETYQRIPFSTMGYRTFASSISPARTLSQFLNPVLPRATAR